MSEVLYTDFKRTKRETWERQREKTPSLEPPTQEQILQDWLEFIEKRAQMKLSSSPCWGGPRGQGGHRSKPPRRDLFSYLEQMF